MMIPGQAQPTLPGRVLNGPPPSTAAAQIVDQPINSDGNQTYLRHLLEELLDTERGDGSGPELAETSLEINYRLIYIIVRAGLEDLTAKLKENTSEVLLQAVNTLAVVELTILRVPDVLVFLPPDDDPFSKPGGPIFLWLIPQLVRLLSFGLDERIGKATIKTLKAAVSAPTRPNVAVTTAFPTLRYTQGIVNEILHGLEQMRYGQGPMSVPTRETITQIYEDYAHLPQPILYEVAIGNADQVFSVVLILSALISTSRDTRNLARIRGLNLIWLLGCLQDIWSHVKLEHFSDPGKKVCLQSLMLKTARSCLSYVSLASHDAVAASKVSFLICEIMVHVLKRDTKIWAALEEELFLSMLELLVVAKQYAVVLSSFRDCVWPVLSTLQATDPSWRHFSQPLQRVFEKALLLNWENFSEYEFKLEDSSVSKDQELKSRSHSASIQFDGGDHLFSGRPQKRPRLSGDQNFDTLSRRPSPLSQLLTSMIEEGSFRVPDEMPLMFRENYGSFADEEQCEILELIEILACKCANGEGRETCLCSRCSVKNELATQQPEEQAKSLFFKDMLTIFSELIKSGMFQKVSRSRIAAMLCLRRLLDHTENVSDLDLSGGTIGQWCLRSLQSSQRELRIAAGRTVPCFVRDRINPSVLHGNRVLALDVLRSQMNVAEVAFHESCILACGQTASCTSSEDETNLVLLRLVEYLGHPNSLVASVAFDELLRLSSHSPLSASRLFEPYWRTIAVTIIKDLQSRPQIAKRVSDLLAIDVSQLLRMTQYHTIPFLILTKRRDILQRIADISEQKSIKAICMEPVQLAAILSSLLLQYSTNVESMISLALIEVSTEFKDFDLIEAANSNPMLIAFELLKAAGEMEEGKVGRAHQSIQYLAGLTQRRGGSSRGSSKRVDMVGHFFQSYVLAIMALLSETISESKGFQPVSERKRCVGAIRAMIQLAQGHIMGALPQVSACLKSAIEDKDLCNDGMVAWDLLLQSLDQTEITDLIDPTTALIAHYWNNFDSPTQQRAADMIRRLLMTSGHDSNETLKTMPSLGHIPMLSKYADDISSGKAAMDPRTQLQYLANRCDAKNLIVVIRALKELEDFLYKYQSFICSSALSAQPDPAIPRIIRAVLDVCVRFSGVESEVSLLSAKCLGLIGSIDHNRVEAVSGAKEILVQSNFAKADETTDFVLFFLREVLVKVFLSATNTRAQSFLGYAIQELLKFCNINTTITARGDSIEGGNMYRRWLTIPEYARDTLTPFITSRYVLTTVAPRAKCSYPIFAHGSNHSSWLRTFVFDLLRHGAGENAKMIFGVCGRVVRGQDIAIAEFLLPCAALNVVLGGTTEQRMNTMTELRTVLSHDMPENNSTAREMLILCSQNVFKTLDYFSLWVQEKRKTMRQMKSAAERTGRAIADIGLDVDISMVNIVADLLQSIPAEMMSRRAIECKSYSRALFYWEQFIREERQKASGTKFDNGPMYEKLQDIYSQIDEPDGIEGIAAHLQVLNVDQQVLQHKKAGRWTAVQSWYELLLAENPDDTHIQLNLLTSLKESGQHDVLLNQVAALPKSESTRLLARPFAIESAWTTGKWDQLSRFLPVDILHDEGDFTIHIGAALQALREQDLNRCQEVLDRLRVSTARSMSRVYASSFQSCHDALLRFHVIAEVQALGMASDPQTGGGNALINHLGPRLDLLGAFSANKQYVLALRRAAMQLSQRNFSKLDISASWLTSARLQRKANQTSQAFNSVLHASRLGDISATIEHSRLLWKEGQHRKAIQSLEGAIFANAFASQDNFIVDDSTDQKDRELRQNILTAKAHLLLAKWTDRAGQTQSDVIIQRYKKVVEFHNRWEKGHYYLGRHYNKLLESEKLKPPAKQAQTFITGETAKLVIENYLRSMAFGAKYIYQTLPRIITLWLEFGIDVEKQLDPKYGNDESFRAHVVSQRRKLFAAVTTQTKKYIDRLPAFVWYTSFSQIVARICHSNHHVFNSLVDIITKVVLAHPQQATWALLALVKSSAKERSFRGAQCMNKILESSKKARNECEWDLKTMLIQGQKLSEHLLRVCEGEVEPKVTLVSISKDLGFNHKLAPCGLVIPIEAALTAGLPPVSDNVNIKSHKAFRKDPITIEAFLDEVTVLHSLVRPKKISIRTYSGQVYSLLCKPKDDLRKDQRLLEFNAMINRLLKKDAETSKRRLYIKTYAVTPLNEECGLIEWVDNLKTIRDILLRLYRQKSILVNFNEIRERLDHACSDKRHAHEFNDILLPMFPPVFHEWFVEMFPEPNSWFAARLRYTRSAAVMSVVGHVLGLGDRHCENMLLEEGDGGTFHVDFNCLFDKGRTFEKPELVPFRLTQNMVDAFGAYGYEGPFRKSCELTLGLLRLNDDTLMTVLETFLYDPTTDFVDKKKKRAHSGVPTTPEGVLESVRNKVRGLLPAESVPLSVEGYVQELIKSATDPMNLASMYVGWCSWF